MSLCGKCGGKADAFLCWHCGRTLDEQLGRLPWLADRLSEAHTKQTRMRPPPTRVQKPRSEDDEESPVPYDKGAHNAYDELRTVCMRWVHDLCEQEGIDYFPVDAVPADFIGPLPKFGQHRPGRGYVPDRRDRWRMRPDYIPSTRDLARWLRAHYLVIVNSEDAVLCASEIAAGVESAIRVLNGPSAPVYCGPCPTVVDHDSRGRPQTCDEALYARRVADGNETEPHVTCWRCRERHDVAQLKQKIYARADNFLLTAAEIFRVLDDLNEHVPRNRFYAWRDGGEIKPRGWMHDGRIVQVKIYRSDRPVFSLGEVRQLRGQLVDAA